MINYEEGLMERSDWMKYRMYRVLVAEQAKVVTIADLSKQLCISYSAAYAVFDELLLDLMDMVDQPREAIRKRLLQANQLPMALTEYRATLVNRSANFKLVTYILEASEPTMVDYCQATFTTRSTVGRKLKRLNCLLQSWNVSIRLRGMQFKGEETDIRLALAEILAWSCTPRKWPFVKCGLHEMIVEYRDLSILSADSNIKWRDQLFLTVSYLRNRSHHLLRVSPMLAAMSHQQAENAHRTHTEAMMAPGNAALFRFIQVRQRQRSLGANSRFKVLPNLGLENNWSQPFLNQLHRQIEAAGYPVDMGLTHELTSLFAEYALFSPFDADLQASPSNLSSDLVAEILALTSIWTDIPELHNISEQPTLFAHQVAALVTKHSRQVQSLQTISAKR